VLDHSPAKGSDRLVLISIANHAGQNPVGGAWEAWPGIGTLQREARLDRARTVNDALARLVEAGQIERVVNGAPDEHIRKDRRPNLYRVLISHGVTCGDTRCRWCGVPSDVTPPPDDGVTLHAPRGDVLPHHGVTSCDATGCREASPEPSLEPSLKPSEEPQPLSLALGGDAALVAEVAFGEFWKVYPRRVGPGAARKAWAKAIRKAPAQRIIDAAARYAAETHGRPVDKIAHPTTWLNGERWDDEPGANAGPQRGKPPGGAGGPVTSRRDGPEGRVRA
jgi:hypothetical protein